MRNAMRLIVLFVPTLLLQTLWADTIELKNGTAIQGKYVSGTATTISIETAQGVLSVPTADMIMRDVDLQIATEGDALRLLVGPSLFTSLLLQVQPTRLHAGAVVRVPGGARASEKELSRHRGVAARQPTTGANRSA